MSKPSRVTIACEVLKSNFALLDQKTGPHCEVAAVVKANGYGIGMTQMAKTLYQAGCRSFYTAQLSEAVALRIAFRDANISDANIFVFEGPQPDTPSDFDAYRRYDLVAVINSEPQLHAYLEDAKTHTFLAPLACWLHIDTGMARLGLAPDYVLGADLSGANLKGVISHLANGDAPRHPQNLQQLERFTRLTASVSNASNLAFSLANSGGIFMGADYHFSQVRPGLALHGYASDAKSQNTSGLQPILRWDAPILQIRHLRTGDTVGYGSSFVAKKPMVVAAIGAGYADGYRRKLGAYGKIEIGGYITRPIGHISMDLMVIDVSDVPSSVLAAAQEVCLLGPHYTAQNMADDLDMIIYEILTGLGDRVVRAYNTAN